MAGLPTLFMDAALVRGKDESGKGRSMDPVSGDTGYGQSMLATRVIHGLMLQHLAQGYAS